MEISGKDPIDKATAKQIAISVAFKNDDKEILNKLNNNQMLESEIIQYVGGSVPSDI